MSSGAGGSRCESLPRYGRRRSRQRLLLCTFADNSTDRRRGDKNYLHMLVMVRIFHRILSFTDGVLVSVVLFVQPLYGTTSAIGRFCVAISDTVGISLAFPNGRKT
jgi:hypothetical protein